MESDREQFTHGSSPKRIKLDLGGSNTSVLCGEEGFSSFSSPVGAQNDISEAISADCDSGYEASTMESMPTPSHQRSPFSSTGERDCFLPTSSQLDNVTQDSIDGIEDDQDDNNGSTVSELSGLSDLSGQDWKPMAGSMTWIQKQMQSGTDPRELLTQLGVSYEPHNLDDVTLWKLIINMIAEPPRRHKLRHVNTLDDIIRLLKGAKNIIVLTGAGVSVSCGIPDFRSRDGIYSRLAIDFPDLPDPQAMFDISYFNQDPRPFFKFARDIYPGKFQPSPCHRFIKLLEKHNKLLRNYTQNIDTLEKVADIQRVIECHGSFATATCTRCGVQVTADTIRETVLAQSIPRCERCHKGGTANSSSSSSSATAACAIPITEMADWQSDELRELVRGGIMKPDIIFFGEGLPDSFHDSMSADKYQCDLLLVIGSSLKVRPVALIPNSLPAEVPQILINREPLPHCHFDVELLGDCDVIINHLCQIMGNSWSECIYDEKPLREAKQLLPWKTDDDDLIKPSSKKPTESTSQNNTSSLVNDLTTNTDKCTCNSTNNSSSSAVATLPDTTSNPCKLCQKNPTIENDNTSSLNAIKARHMSIDSARDSGIGDNSNFTDLDMTKYDEPDVNTGELLSLSNIKTAGGFDSEQQSPNCQLSNTTSHSSSYKCEQQSTDCQLSTINTTSHGSSYKCEQPSSSGTTTNSFDSSSSYETTTAKCSGGDTTATATSSAVATGCFDSSDYDHMEDLRGYWQPKQKRSILERLPAESFYLMAPNRYIFPGTELFYDPDVRNGEIDSDSDSSEEDSGEEEERDDVSLGNDVESSV